MSSISMEGQNNTFIVFEHRPKEEERFARNKEIFEYLDRGRVFDIKNERMCKTEDDGIVSLDGLFTEYTQEEVFTMSDIKVNFEMDVEPILLCKK